MQQKDEIGWTGVMDRTFQRAHVILGYQEKDIKEACASVPIDAALLQASDLKRWQLP